MGDRLEGKVALISAAGAGIGEAVARKFAAEGAHLWLNDVDPVRLDDLVGELNSQYGNVAGSAGDVSDSVFVNSWVDAAVERYGHLDVLYNNAGIASFGLIAEISDAEWRRQQAVTLDSVFYVTRAVLPHMVTLGSGSIVSMSSGAGIGGSPNLGSYGAAKAGVINLMETVAMEYARHGIRANAVTPGPTLTGPLRATAENTPGGEEAITKGLVLRRASRPEEVANLVTFLASDESSNITGILIRSNIPAKAGA
jgi:meso-butanediol dehydrogenase / (S,S)-butanediol dehydrogenase / diacetyl reductase